MAVRRDYYEVLSIAKSANGDEIKKAYRKLAMEFHPDRNPDDPQAEIKFKEATEAYEVLKDPDRRARYDRYGHEAASAGGPAGAGFEGFGERQSIHLVQQSLGEADRRCTHLLKLADVCIHIRFETLVRKHLIHETKRQRLLGTDLGSARDQFKGTFL